MGYRNANCSRMLQERNKWVACILFRDCCLLLSSSGSQEVGLLGPEVPLSWDLRRKSRRRRVQEMLSSTFFFDLWLDRQSRTYDGTNMCAELCLSTLVNELQLPIFCSLPHVPCITSQAALPDYSHIEKRSL